MNTDPCKHLCMHVHTHVHMHVPLGDMELILCLMKGVGGQGAPVQVAKALGLLKSPQPPSRKPSVLFAAAVCLRKK